MKMIKTSCGLMTPLEAKMIGDIDHELRRKKKYLNRPKAVRK